MAGNRCQGNVGRTWAQFSVAAAILFGGAACGKAADADQVARGRELFTRVWKPHDPHCGGDGLGPRFNDRSCVACHMQGGPGGGGPHEKNVQILEVKPLAETSAFKNTESAQLDYMFHGISELPFVLHRFGVSSNYPAWRRDRLASVAGTPEQQEFIKELRIDDLARRGLVAGNTPTSPQPLRPGPQPLGPGPQPLRPLTPTVEPELMEVVLNERNTSALFGAGQIDELPVEVFEKMAASEPSEVRGRVAYLTDGHVGRFGWKAQNETLLDFNMNACAVELGLDNPAHHQLRIPTDPEIKAGTSPKYDLTQEDCEALSAYVASLSQPHQSAHDLKRPDVEEGEYLFNKIGCAQCHVRDLGSIKGLYSDLLLHQSGTKLVGGTYYRHPYLASIDVQATPARYAPPLPDEWRTPPLWGCADSAPYLHDGRAKTLKDAILLHGGQAEESKDTFERLHTAEAAKIIAFLQSLRAPGIHEPPYVGPTAAGAQTEAASQD